MDTTDEIKRGLHKNFLSLFHVVRKALEYKQLGKVGVFLRDTTISEFSLAVIQNKSNDPVKGPLFGSFYYCFGSRV